MRLECKHCGAVAHAAPDCQQSCCNRRTLECHVCDHVGFVPSFDNEFDDEPATREIPRETMAALVYNPNRSAQ